MVKAVDQTAAVEILFVAHGKDEIPRAEIAELRRGDEKSTAFQMQTFDKHLFTLYRDGRITLDEAVRNADKRE